MPLSNGLPTQQKLTQWFENFAGISTPMEASYVLLSIMSWRLQPQEGIGYASYTREGDFMSGFFYDGGSQERWQRYYRLLDYSWLI